MSHPKSLSRVLQRTGLLLLFGTLTACQSEPKSYHEQAYLFGTIVDITIVGQSENKARAASKIAMDELTRLHQKLHAWQKSDLSRLNEAISGGKTHAVDAELGSILRDAQTLSRQSEYLFNPAIGHLIATWGFQSETFKEQLPNPSEIDHWRKANPNLSNLNMDGLNISSNNTAVKIDLGGYAKGYALDRVAEKLQALGINNALINIGGNILALGQHGNRPWRVGIQHPRQAGALASLPLYDGEAIGTSGDYQRYFMVNKQRYCHLINPNTGYPQQAVQAVTIIIKGKRAGVLSDVLSKPLFISGPDQWQQQAKKLGVSEVLLVNQHGKVEVTSNLAKRLNWVNKPNHVHVVSE